MAGNSMSVVAMACLIALIQISASAATSYTVGDSTGWTNPSDSSLYTNWVSGKTFNVGDTLLFSFSAGHTVSEVTKSEYEACSSSNPISSKSTGPVTITLTTAGDHYYICLVQGHCDAGQKLAVTVGSSSTPSAPTPTSSTTTPSPPPPSPTTATPSPPPPPSSSPAVVAGFVMPFLIGAAAFFF